MTATDYEQLLEHLGHHLEIGEYINPKTGEVLSVTIECMTCYEVLIDCYEATEEVNE